MVLEEELLELELDFELELELSVVLALVVVAAAASVEDLSLDVSGVVVPPSIRSAVTGPSVSSDAVAAYDESVAEVEPGGAVDVVPADAVAAASTGGVVQELEASEELSEFMEVLGVV